jgi:hypothetical protein
MSFQPHDINADHVLRAVTKIERDQIQLIPSTRFDVVVNGKAYPPKEIGRYAHEQYNGEKVWQLSGGPPTNELLSELGFEIREKQASRSVEIRKRIEQYKSHIRKTHLQGEIYKWQLIDKFRGRPDLNVEDFGKEIRSIDYKNLIFRNANGVLHHLARERPDQ